MCPVSYIFWAVAVCFLDQALSQSSLCTTKLMYGGTCVSLREACPVGTYEYEAFSNYLGCERVDQKCCASNTQGTVKNPNGIVVTPPLTCGIGSLLPSSRILDGGITEPCDWPFVVSIRSLTSQSSELTYAGTTHACQGVLIHEQWVLTSPICIISAANTAQEAPDRMLVVAGEYNTTGIDLDPVTRTPQEQVIRVSQVYMHPNYAFKNQEEVIPFDNVTGINSNAVALIRLAEPITGRCSGIACLPTASEAANNCARYDECVITGWGFRSEVFEGGITDDLLIGLVQLISGVACDFLTQRLGLSAIRPIGTLCQNPRNRNTDSCLGDEGGAVLCSNGNNWVVRGIIPFNVCLNGRYNLFVTDINPYLNWIQTTMANSG